MTDTTDCRSASESVIGDLPTRQKNALRLLLGKASFTPEEVAAIDYRVIERAPGVGKNSLAIINAWLGTYGYAPKGFPTTAASPREAQRRRKLERAIDYLHGHGYEVHRSR